jgi:hypothetical protein
VVPGGSQRLVDGAMREPAPAVVGEYGDGGVSHLRVRPMLWRCDVIQPV